MSAGILVRKSEGEMTRWEA